MEQIIVPEPIRPTSDSLSSIGRQKPAPARKSAIKAADAVPAPSPADVIEKQNLCVQVKDLLLEMGFNLFASYSLSFSEFVKMKLPYQLVKVYVKDNAAKDELWRQTGINPNYFEITDQANKGAIFVVRSDITENIVSSIAGAYASKHGLRSDDKNQEEIFWQTAKKLSTKDPEILAIAEEIKKRDFDPGNPLTSWNDQKLKIGNNQVPFVNFYDFNSEIPNDKIIPLDRESEEFVYNYADYRIKDQKKLVCLLETEAEKLGIKIADLSPSEAIIFAARVVEKYLDYDYRLMADRFGQGEGLDSIIVKRTPEEAARLKAKDPKVMGELMAENRKSDERAGDELLENRSGVCRHYARVFNAIFYILKTLDPKLANTYSASMTSENHGWVLVMNLEEKNGKTRMTAAMLDPTTDDSDNIFYNDLDASDMAADKYATAELFQRFGLKDDFRKLFNDNSSDPDFQIFMLSNLANKADQMGEGAYGELEKLAQAAIDNPKCSPLQKYCIRKLLWDIYVTRGEFEKALRCFEQEKNENLSYVDRHAENLFYARYYLYKGEFSRAEGFARKCESTLETKLLLARILFDQKKQDPALAVLIEIFNAYDYSEYKLDAGLRIAEILTEQGKPAEAQKYLEQCQKLCLTKTDRFELTLSRARVERSAGSGAAEARYSELMTDYADIFNENLENAYSSSFQSDDLLHLAVIAIKNNDLLTFKKLFLLEALMKMVKG